ncbi:MAG: hypothetical protein A2Z17_03515 [Gammaproteobacteria bacterium RBG_16_66_13]|nr:MAG: hypothetical protein A2Z17_03515 [Gammaproteobacteria bacterium RBG_16_66_13]
MSLPAIYLGLLISTLLGAAFHLLRGGTLGRLFLYVSTAWIAFFAGHWVASLLRWELGRVGSLNLFPAILATLIGLTAASILAGPAGNRTPHTRPPDENDN